MISKGQSFYETALKNPDRLANETSDWKDFFITDIKGCIVESYNAKAKEKVLDAAEVPSPVVFDYESKAEGGESDWDESRLKKKFPKLHAKYYND